MNPFGEFLLVQINSAGDLLNFTRKPLSMELMACLPLSRGTADPNPPLMTPNEVLVVFILLFVTAFIVDRIVFFFTKLMARFRTDQDLNAGTGNLGLTISSLVSQLVHPTLILNSVGFAQFYGIIGPVVFALFLSISASVFAFILLEMRIKAPGAKTYPQIVRSRFGKGAHIIVVGIFMAADVTNYVVVTMNGLHAMMSVSLEPHRERLIVYLFIAICSFVIASQLGSFRVIMATIAVFILGLCTVLMLSVFHNSAQYPLGTIDRVYKLLRCYDERVPFPHVEPLSIIKHRSVVATILTSAVIWSTFLVCQANWSVGIALTPNHSSVGFILASFAIFSIPFVLSTCLGLGFLALSSSLGSNPLRIMHQEHGMNKKEIFYDCFWFSTLSSV
ncbi:unnamed protein product [Dibothriocephalus latus]|uniref:Amino acid transporter transmembrane domain-containing protein n=1 Tax=Dibothriocephalus latus TaxID=60516 RepID=A0A3P7LDN2_DIBLA|nr:unnamed protein product [Dibothriocephalus latus]